MLRMSSTPNTPIGSRRKADTVYVSNNNNNNQKSVARQGTSKRPLNNNNQKSDTRRVRTKNATNSKYPFKIPIPITQQNKNYRKYLSIRAELSLIHI